jgi:hypothetical protein
VPPRAVDCCIAPAVRESMHLDPVAVLATMRFPRRSSCGGRSQQVLADTPVCDPRQTPVERGARRALIEAVVGGAGTALLLPPKLRSAPLGGVSHGAVAEQAAGSLEEVVPGRVEL